MKSDILALAKLINIGTEAITDIHNSKQFPDERVRELAFNQVMFQIINLAYKEGVNDAVKYLKT